jgi:hypothetical protein
MVNQRTNLRPGGSIRMRAASLSLAAVAALGLGAQARAATTVFSTGGDLMLPEAIIPAPASILPGGGYVIPDASIGFKGPGQVLTVPLTGGTPTQLTDFGTNFFPIGAAVLPGSYGALAGQLIVTGESGATKGAIDSVAASGAATTLFTSSTVSQFTSAVVAPAGFGAVGGDVLIGDSSGGISALAANGASVKPFATVAGIDTFGLAFAPAGFGKIGGDLLATDGSTGKLYAVTPTGASSLFATVSVPAITSNAGLRQLAFAPAGYGAYGGDLFLSISGSEQGGGNLGEIVVLDSSGDQVAIFDQGSTANPLDPRGLYFVSNTELLASNGDPEIDLITPSSFVGVPAPGPLAWLLPALALLGWTRLGARRGRPIAPVC